MKIAVLAGDGVGPEVIAEAVKVLTALGREGLKLEFEQAPVGGAAYDAAGDPLPSPTLELAGKADAILFGAVGGPRYDAAPGAGAPAAAQGTESVRQPSPGGRFPRARRRVHTQAGSGGWTRYPDRARADRRHLLRRAAGHPEA